ncbi:hypothetical protein [Pectinatus frisingensis]|uniref:hypothetical protein n=1 Tax=Pectinatus frisingensis TaxID=865 RepID=UPI0018C7336F|nr:hypothetical protein [Pectinatus frisingensis]
MSKKIMCPICLSTKGEYHEMFYKSDGYFKCPSCKSEVWPNELPPDELTQFMREMAKTHYSTDALPAGEALKGRSGSGNSKTRKPPNNKKTVGQLNAGLHTDFESR